MPTIHRHPATKSSFGVQTDPHVRARSMHPLQAYSQPMRRADVLSRMTTDIFSGMRSLRDRIVAGITALRSRPEVFLEKQSLKQLRQMDTGFETAGVDKFGLTKQAVRDMEGDKPYVLSVDHGPDRYVTVTPFKAKNELIIKDSPTAVSGTTLTPSEELGAKLGIGSDLLRKAFYFANQEMLATVETPLTTARSSPLVRAVGLPFSFTGSPDLRYSIRVAGDVATVSVQYSRSNISHLTVPGNGDVIETVPEETNMQLKFALQVELGKATRFVPGCTTLNFKVARAPK